MVELDVELIVGEDHDKDDNLPPDCLFPSRLTFMVHRQSIVHLGGQLP